MKKSFIYILLLVLLFIFILAGGSIKILIDYWWFKNIGYEKRFLKEIYIKIFLFFITFGSYLIFSYINYFITKHNSLSGGNVINSSLNLSQMFTPPSSYIMHFYILISGFILALVVSSHWEMILKFYNKVPFNLKDPIFGKDISFYTFSLPYYTFIKNILFWFIFLNLTLSIICYILTKKITFIKTQFYLTTGARIHIGLQLILLVATLGYTYVLKRYTLLFNQYEIVKGANYVDIHARLPAYTIIIVGFIILEGIIIFWIFKKKSTILTHSLIGAIVLIIIINGIYPFFLQKFVVAPNEIKKERPYIEYTIRYTRYAYNLHNVKEKWMKLKTTPDKKIFLKNREILENIRLWDWRPLKTTFKQLQEIRPYYIFGDVDVDRYIINGRLREVMLSAREISHTSLPREARNWINRYLKYTHGYGIVMIPVNEKSSEGLPVFYIKDIPPVSLVDIKITRPEIYYGETMRDYVIVNSATPEFDYPGGAKNVYSHYKGYGGIPLDSGLKKIVFSFYLGTFKIFLSEFITPTSRLMLYRNIVERTRKIVPFLGIDNDPYIVTIKGKLYWIIDCYTFSDNFPYAELYDNEFNYIRNSVKAVIDAYNGDIKFYIVDKNDPIAKVYAKIFPGLFKDIKTLDKEFIKHFRYPEDIFVVQSEIFRYYHIKDPEVFYNREDVWDFPTELYQDSEVLMTPYYIITKLEDSNKLEFLNIIPFTPSKKNNMIAWFAARCDMPDYGKLTVIRFTKEKLIYGPMQIEARIDQHPDISKLLSLWGQKGSRVIRGNLLVIPVKDILLYVEPLYLKAERSELPELKKIIVACGDKLGIGDTLWEAIDNMFTYTEPKTEEKEEKQSRKSVKELVDEAWDNYINAMKSLKNGEWAKYGEYISKLEIILRKLKEYSK